MEQRTYHGTRGDPLIMPNHDLLEERGASGAFLLDRKIILYFAMPSPHTPISPSKAVQGKSGINRYADFVMETDRSVGQIMKAVEESAAAENTILIFTADNGTAASDRALADNTNAGEAKRRATLCSRVALSSFFSQVLTDG